MKNIEAIQDEQARRDAVWKVVNDADEVVMKRLCRHCLKRETCMFDKMRQHHPLMREDECVDGLIKWMYEDKEEMQDGRR